MPKRLAQLLTAANITLAEGADICAEYATQIQLGTITAIDGLVELKSASTIDAVYRYAFLHRGIGAWSCYVLAGISLAFFSYSRGLPLTIGLGLASFSSGLYNITGAEWLIVDGEPGTGSRLVALAVVMVCSTLSALSGDGLADARSMPRA